MMLLHSFVQCLTLIGHKGPTLLINGRINVEHDCLVCAVQHSTSVRTEIFALFCFDGKINLFPLTEVVPQLAALNLSKRPDLLQEGNHLENRID